MAVVKGFEPLEGLHPHTLSRSVSCRPRLTGTVREQGERVVMIPAGPSRTAANETKTETTRRREARHACDRRLPCPDDHCT